jgi:hypothetical protein
MSALKSMKLRPRPGEHQDPAEPPAKAPPAPVEPAPPAPYRGDRIALAVWMGCALLLAGLLLKDLVWALLPW